MKKHLVAAGLLAVLLMNSACSGTQQNVEKHEHSAAAELISSEAKTVAETEAGKVSGYIDNGVYIKVSLMLRPNALCLLCL